MRVKFLNYKFEFEFSNDFQHDEVPCSERGLCLHIDGDDMLAQIGPVVEVCPVGGPHGTTGTFCRNLVFRTSRGERLNENFSSIADLGRGVREPLAIGGERRMLGLN